MATQNPIRYKSLLAWSSNSVGVPAGAQATLTWSISEQGISGRFVADTTTGVFSGLIHRNVNLSTGFSPLSLLQSDSEINPRSRRFVAVNDPMQITFSSTAGTAASSCSLTTAPVKGLPNYYEGDAYRDGVRNLLVAGSTNFQTIAPGAAAQFQIDLQQSFQAGYICVGAASGLAGLYVTSIEYDNQNLIDGQFVPAEMFAANNTDSPLFGAMLETNHDFFITVANLGAAPAVDVACAVTAG